MNFIYDYKYKSTRDLLRMLMPLLFFKLVPAFEVCVDILLNNVNVSLISKRLYNVRYSHRSALNRTTSLDISEKRTIAHRCPLLI